MEPPFASYDVEACRARIAARNDVLNAVLRVVPPRPPRVGAQSAIAGVPYVLKDTWDTAGIVTTGGSWRHRARVPLSSAHIHLALEAAGAVLLGKSNLGDLAFSTESDNHIRGPVKNPYDLTRTAGGSTGGAAAIADGMAAFDWGTDFGGSIRGPAAWCGVVGLRLSTKTWPVEYHHFPRLAPSFWDWCGMGPITKTVAGARTVASALAGALRRDVVAPPKIDPDRVVLWAPDAAHRDAWPSFVEDAQDALDRAGVGWVVGRDLPTPSWVNSLFMNALAASFDAFMDIGELSVTEGAIAVLLGLLGGGRLDKRVHPNTGVLLAGVMGVRARHHDKARAAEQLADVRDRVNAVWRSGALIVSPTTTVLPPRHGKGALTTRSMSFCKLGNLADATALAIPFGTFSSEPALPRSLQILGPPGSEDAVFALGERLGEGRPRYSKPIAISISNIASATSGDG